MFKRAFPGIGRTSCSYAEELLEIPKAFGTGSFIRESLRDLIEDHPAALKVFQVLVVWAYTALVRDNYRDFVYFFINGTDRRELMNTLLKKSFDE